ncbi:MAG: EAL domain-containing protein [Bulleidia sp.]
MALKRKVLVVEDSAVNREILTSILEEQYEVIQAENGEEALQVLNRYKDSISIILLDVIMPVMDGYAFLDTIRHDEELSRIPVIVMTQNDGEEDEVFTLSHGATDFVPKPYRAQVILHRMANLIKLRETSAVVNQFKYDRLTGLFSKEYFYTKAAEFLMEHPDEDYCIICSNIENFKLVNDVFGVRQGDLLLQETAELIRVLAGERGICGRFSSDRFLCLQSMECKHENEEIIRSFKENRDSSLLKTVMMRWGIYMISDRRVSVEQMCDRAMLAAESIKGKYNRDYAIYDDALRAALLREKKLTDSMVTALNEKQFQVYLQPKYDIRQRRICGAEALIRWIHPELGFISPGEFIPLFEKNGFIGKMDMYVWRSVCEKLKEWKDSGLPVYPVSVNVSRADLYQNDPVEMFTDLIHEYGIRPSDLHLEITESAYAEDTDRIITTVRELREHGFIIEMDDFGSGYSSLNMLSAMSVDILKLDMKFIQSELQKPEEISILNDIVTMAHRMHLKVVAEGVETQEQETRLNRIGCDMAQGYYFARPMPVKEYEELIRNQKGSDVQSETEQDERKVLIAVDEDAEYCRIIHDTFESTYHVISAHDAKEALKVIEETGCENIAVMILSMNLPDHGAKKIMDVIRRVPISWQIPVLATIPGYAGCQNLAVLAGTDDFLCKRHPVSDLRRRVQHLVDIAAFSKKEMRLLDEATHDVLTGLLNRRGLDRALSTMHREDMPCAFCLFDLDGLKQINDTCGHDRGDQVLKEFAEVLQKNTRVGDIQCRYGGDEFLLVLRHVNSCQDALAKCDDICHQFAEQMKSMNIHAGVSCGTVICHHIEEKMEAISTADQALYRAKYEKRGHACLCGKQDR